MKTILVPTDFSNTAEKAFKFASMLAKKLNSRLVLVHAYQVSVPLPGVPFGVLNDERRQLNDESEKQFKALKLKMDRVGDPALECISIGGKPSECILSLAKEKQADLIIMGTTGQTGLSRALFGSVSLGVMEKAGCPVMAIPPGFSINNIIRKITYATNYHTSDLAAISKAVEIARSIRAQLNILHISDTLLGADEEKELMFDFMEKVNDKSDYNDLSFQIIQGHTIEQTLEQYLEDGSTDMLMMATHYRDFLDKLFGESVTRNIVRETTVPVVAFHFNAKTSVKLY